MKYLFWFKREGALFIALFLLLPLGAAGAESKSPMNCEPCITESNRGHTCEITNREQKIEVRCGGGNGGSGMAAPDSAADSAEGMAPATGASKKTAETIGAARDTMESARKKAGNQARFNALVAVANGGAAVYLFRKSHLARKKCTAAGAATCPPATTFAALGTLAGAQAAFSALQWKKMNKLKGDLGSGADKLSKYEEEVKKKYFPEDPKDPDNPGDPDDPPGLPIVGCQDNSGDSCRGVEIIDGTPVVIGPGENDRTDISTFAGNIDREDPEIQAAIAETQAHVEEEMGEDIAWDSASTFSPKSATSSIAGGGAVPQGAALSGAAGSSSAGEDEVYEDLIVDEPDSDSEQWASGSGNAVSGGGGSSGGGAAVSGGGLSEEDEMNSFLEKFGFKKRKKAKAKKPKHKPVVFGKDKIAHVSKNIFHAVGDQYSNFRNGGEFLYMRSRRQDSGGSQ